MLLFRLILFANILSLCSATLEIEYSGDEKMCYLKEIYGHRINVIDSSRLSKNRFVFDDISNTGMYKVVIGKNVFDVLIEDDEDISLSISNGSIDVENDKNNKVYNFYKSLLREKFNLRNAIEKKLSNVRSDNENFDHLKKTTGKINDYYEQKIKKLIANNKDNFAGKYIKARFLLEKYGFNAIEKLELDKNPEIFRTDLINQAIFKELIQDNSDEELIDKMETNVDRILILAYENEELLVYTLEYLITIFEKIGPKELEFYIIENYLIGNECMSNNLTGYLDNYEKIKRSSPGSIVQNIKLKNNISIDELFKGKDFLLLFFQKSNCRFCKQAKQFINDYREEFIRENVEILNICENSGDLKKLIDKFSVYKYPTFILIDKKMEIKIRASNLDELFSFFKIG